MSMNMDDVLKISDFVREQLIEAVGKGKDIEFKCSRGVREGLEDSTSIQTCISSGEIDISLKIPADS